MAADGPHLVEGYRGIILARQARKWVKIYKNHLPLMGVHGSEVFEEILAQNFSKARSHSGSIFFPRNSDQYSG